MKVRQYDGHRPQGFEHIELFVAEYIAETKGGRCKRCLFENYHAHCSDFPCWGMQGYRLFVNTKEAIDKYVLAAVTKNSNENLRRVAPAVRETDAVCRSVGA